jgi:type II secretory pathway component GspD/PulD (secretin)
LVDVVRHLYPSVSQAAQGLPSSVSASGEYSSSSASARLDNKSDRIIFQGTPGQVQDLKRLLAVLDVVTPSIELQVFLIEHTKTKGKQSGFAALVDKVGPFSLAVGSIPGAGDVLRFASGGVQLAISALRTDNEFSVYTSPKLLLVDGKKSRLVVGQDVPVLTSTTTTDQGIVQGIEYRSSGVIMEASANILDDAIEIDSTIEVSSFAETTTGVSMSPTLTKRALQSSTVLSDGFAVLFGGLNSANQNEGSTGLQFLPRFLRTNSAGSDEKELFILMSARRI